MLKAIMRSKEHILRAISILGGPTRVAEALGLPRYQNVQQWVYSGRIPPKYCPSVERLTDGAVRCEDLCPGVDWAYLRGTDCTARHHEVA